jgi:hypothetical protein
MLKAKARAMAEIWKNKSLRIKNSSWGRNTFGEATQLGL